MIRPLTVLGCVAFLGAGFHVYQTKAQVDDLGQELRRVLQATEAERVRSRTLSAEWARLNDQDRLARLATMHLMDLQPTAPQQFVRVADAGRRLPDATIFTARMSGFSTRADAPSAPGEMLVFSARTMMAQAAPLPAPAPAPIQAVAPAVASPSPTPAPAVVAAPTPEPPANPVIASRPRPAPQPERVAVARATPERNLRPAMHVTTAAQPAPPRAANPSTPANFAPPLGFAGGSVPDRMASSVLVGGGSLPPPMPFRP